MTPSFYTWLADLAFPTEAPFLAKGGCASTLTMSCVARLCAFLPPVPNLALSSPWTSPTTLIPFLPFLSFFPLPPSSSHFPPFGAPRAPSRAHVLYYGCPMPPLPRLRPLRSSAAHGTASMRAFRPLSPARLAPPHRLCPTLKPIPAFWGTNAPHGVRAVRLQLRSCPMMDSQSLSASVAPCARPRDRLGVLENGGASPRCPPKLFLTTSAIRSQGTLSGLYGVWGLPAKADPPPCLPYRWKGMTRSGFSHILLSPSRSLALPLSQHWTLLPSRLLF